MSFERELEDLLNKYCIESKASTPDYIVAKYVMNCLESMNNVIKHRDHWYDLRRKHKFIYSESEETINKVNERMMTEEEKEKLKSRFNLKIKKRDT